MTSEPRPCPDVDPPKQPPNAENIKNQDKLPASNENAVIKPNNLMVTQSIPVLPQETSVTKPENQTQPQDGQAKQECQLVQQQYPIVKSNVLSSHESATLPKLNIKEQNPEVTLDDTVEIREIPSSRHSHPEVSSDHPIHPDVCSECGRSTVSEPEKCAECGRLLTPPPNICAECGQIIPPPPEICPQCGQPIRIEPERCTECGQLIPRRWSIDVDTAFKNLARTYESNTGYMFNDKWSRDGSSCRASTSRKLSHSSGDYDSDNGSYCSDCSCSSNTYSVICEKPCIIADSATFLHKSKWQAFRNYFRRIKRRKRIKCRKNDNNKKASSYKEDDNNVILTPVTGTQDSTLTVSAQD